MESIDVKSLLHDTDPNIRVNACKFILAQNLKKYAHDLNLLSKNDEDWFVKIWAGYVLFNFNPIAKKLFQSIVKSYFKSLNDNDDFKTKLKDELYTIFSSFDFTISQIDTIMHLSQYTLNDFPKNIPPSIFEKLDHLDSSDSDILDETLESNIVDFISSPTTNFDIDSLMALFKATDIKKRKLRDSFFAFKSSKTTNPYLYPKGALNYLDHVNNQITSKKATKKTQTREFNRVIYSNQLLLYFTHFESYIRDIQYIIYKSTPKKFQTRLLKQIDSAIMQNSLNAEDFLTNLIHKFLINEDISIVERLEYFDKKLKIHFGILEHDKDFFYDAIHVKDLIKFNRGIVNSISKENLRIINLEVGELIHLDCGFIEKISLLIEDLSGYLCLRALQKYLKLKV